MSLRVMSFNVHHGAGLDGRVDLARTAAVIRASGADVVGVQEVDRHLSARSGWLDQAGWWAEHLGMHVVHGPTIDLGPGPQSPGGARRRYGNALLSARPVLSWRNLALPCGREAEPRAVLDAVVDVDGTAVRVAVTHLQNRSQPERLAQAGAIVDLLADRAGPAVLLGDMNAVPGSPEVGVLTGALVDAWATAGAGDGLTFAAPMPHARIDFVLTSPDLTATAARVVATDASDHFPVVVDLVATADAPAVDRSTKSPRPSPVPGPGSPT